MKTEIGYAIVTGNRLCFTDDWAKHTVWHVFRGKREATRWARSWAAEFHEPVRAVKVRIEEVPPEGAA